MAGEDNYIELSGRVRAVIYKNPENGYAVIRLGTEEGVVFAVGCLPEIFPGERVELAGNWTTHHTYGQQFKIEAAERWMPEDVDGIYDFLSSGAIKGVGEKIAAAIVDAFGRGTLEALANGDELQKISGISARKANDIADQFNRQMGIRRLIAFLMEHSVTPLAAARLYEIYGEEAQKEVETNPYLLTDEYFGAGFFQADNLARRIGYDEESPQRIEAAVLFTLRHNLGNGHVFIPRDKLVPAVAQLIRVEPELVENAVSALEEGQDIVINHVAGVNACYLDTYFRDETYVAERIRSMCGKSRQKVANFDRIIQRIAAQQGIEFAEMQLEAIKTAAESNVTVLTGGPGTGKTTAVKAIIAMFGALGIETLLTAPTGRAAKRMEDLTGMTAATVHRLLGAKRPEHGTGMAFEKNENDLLDCGAVVLDEGSMMDLPLMAALLRAMPPRARLVLVGDGDQLPSVGAGNVFADIIRSHTVPVVRLTEVFRQAEQSMIIRNAHLINEGTMPALENKGGDFFFLQRRSGDEIVDTVASLISERLPKNMGIPTPEIQVLSPTRKGGGGTGELNRRIQMAVNPRQENVEEKYFGDNVFRVGDRVMQTRNNYDIMWTQTERGPDGKDRLFTGTGMFNGDVGYIVAMDSAGAQIDFDGKVTYYPTELFIDLELAYAVTVHKSQGSEYRAVIIAVPDMAAALRARGVIYTAVTRARELTVLVGDKNIFAEMIANDKRQRRYSGLRARLAGEC